MSRDTHDDASLALASPTSPSAKSVGSETTTPKTGSRKSNSALTVRDTLIDPSLSPRNARQPALPTPLPGRRCPLLCCFYAEFDNKVGPKICYQSPAGFMQQPVETPVDRMEQRLDQTFQEISQDPSVHSRINSDSLIDNDNSIFDSCSEYIITGSELSGTIINLSANNIHVLSRPTMIANERYERNSLLFCVGFILRRTEDSRPFRPVLNKWALALEDMELESKCLSMPSKRPAIQHHLERLLVSLNSSSWECNLRLNNANVLNLKLFHPPKIPARPVSEFAVPIFLRRDIQMHMVITK